SSHALAFSVSGLVATLHGWSQVPAPYDDVVGSQSDPAGKTMLFPAPRLYVMTRDGSITKLKRSVSHRVSDALEPPPFSPVVRIERVGGAVALSPHAAIAASADRSAILLALCIKASIGS